MSVANARGEKISPGQIGKALEIPAAGGEVDCSVGTDIEFTDVGETNEAYKEQEVNGGKYAVIKVH